MVSMTIDDERLTSEKAHQHRQLEQAYAQLRKNIKQLKHDYDQAQLWAIELREENDKLKKKVEELRPEGTK